MPRFSCACHKLNIIIRTSGDRQKLLNTMLKKLGSFAATNRNSILINNIFNEAQCRPRVENATRWFSQLYVLLWAQSCFKKNIFTDTFVCPVNLKDIETYLQILLPAYQFNLSLQSTNASIAEVLPGVLLLINHWERAHVDAEARELCYFLIHYLKVKFKYELESPIYKVF